VSPFARFLATRALILSADRRCASTKAWT
jgi:hypothetical protein